MTPAEIESLWALEVGAKGEIRLTPLGDAVRRNGREILSRKAAKTQREEATQWMIIGVAGSYEKCRELERQFKRAKKAKESQNGNLKSENGENENGHGTDNGADGEGSAGGI